MIIWGTTRFSDSDGPGKDEGDQENDVKALRMP